MVWTRSLTLALVACGILGAAPAKMSVQVKQGQLRATPSFLGKVIQTAAYGAQVDVLQTQGDWMQVKAGAGQGWMHKSALTTKKLAMASGTGTAKASVSSGELALAGKGFDAGVEAEYRKQNAKADFAAVDRLERREVAASERQAFARKGSLKTEGGAK